MGAKGHISPLEAVEDEVEECDSVPPSPGEESYAKATEVRALPPNLLELLKRTEKGGAGDADLADAADLASLIVSSRVHTGSSAPPPVSGIVPKGEEERDERVPVAPPPARLPRTEIPPPASAPRLGPFSLDFSSNVMFLGVVFGLALAYGLLLLVLR